MKDFAFVPSQWKDMEKALCNQNTTKVSIDKTIGNTWFRIFAS